MSDNTKLDGRQQRHRVAQEKADQMMVGRGEGPAGLERSARRGQVKRSVRRGLVIGMGSMGQQGSAYQVVAAGRESRSSAALPWAWSIAVEAEDGDTLPAERLTRLRQLTPDLEYERALTTRL